MSAGERSAMHPPASIAASTIRISPIALGTPQDCREPAPRPIVSTSLWYVTARADHSPRYRMGHRVSNRSPAQHAVSAAPCSRGWRCQRSACHASRHALLARIQRRQAEHCALPAMPPTKGGPDPPGYAAQAIVPRVRWLSSSTDTSCAYATIQMGVAGG